MIHDSSHYKKLEEEYITSLANSLNAIFRNKCENLCIDDSQRLKRLLCAKKFIVESTWETIKSIEAMENTISLTLKTKTAHSRRIRRTCRKKELEKLQQEIDFQWHLLNKHHERLFSSLNKLIAESELDLLENSIYTNIH